MKTLAGDFTRPENCRQNSCQYSTRTMGGCSPAQSRCKASKPVGTARFIKPGWRTAQGCSRPLILSSKAFPAPPD